MVKHWMRWAPGIFLAVGIFVVGCTEQNDQQGTSRAPGEGDSVSQTPRDPAPPMTPTPSAPQEGARSPEPTQPDAATEQKPEQKQKPQ